MLTMWSTLARPLLRVGASAVAPAGLFANILVMGSSGPAEPAGGGGFGHVICGDRPTPGCDVKALTPGSGKATATGQAAGGRSSGATNRVCRDRSGSVTPCYDPVWGWMGDDHCYYKPIPTPSPELQAAFGGAGTGPGGWYDSVCPGLPGTGGGTGWFPAGALPAPAVDPVILARQAVSRLRLPDPALGMNPAGTQLVGVPTWLWIDPASWRPRSATAAVPGMAVTATASPARVVFSMGDGSLVTCTGPGTPWPNGGDPAAASPTCGHTYTRASTGRPGQAYPVTVTLTWSIRWTGGAQTGTLPDVNSTASTSVRVDENQAVVIGG